MRQTNQIYTKRHTFSAIGMIVTLLWLTVCLPVVYNAYEKGTADQYATSISSGDLPMDEKEANPLSGTTEEKNSSPTSVSEEMLHGDHENDLNYKNKLKHEANHSSDSYIAFHGELLCPPPNILS